MSTTSRSSTERAGRAEQHAAAAIEADTSEALAAGAAAADAAAATGAAADDAAAATAFAAYDKSQACEACPQLTRVFELRCSVALGA